MKKLLLALLLAGCSAGPAQLMTWKDLQRSKDFKGKNVVLEGYPGVIVPNTYSHNGEQQFCLLDLGVGLTSSAQNSVPVVAAAPSLVEPLPDQYKAEDLTLHCEGGKSAKYKDKVRITGKMEWVYGPCIRISKIEKVD